MHHSDARALPGSPPAPPVLPSRELALRSGRVLDFPPRCARLLTMGGACAVIVIVVASLTGNRPATVGVDKLLHFFGYAALATLLVVGLRSRWLVAALTATVALGILIEVLQPLNRRTFDPADALANALGVLVGAALGVALRVGYGYLRTDLASAWVRRNLCEALPGTVLAREGVQLDRFFVVRRGTVGLYRRRGGRQVEVARVGPGEMFGLPATILRAPQPATAVALTPVEAYPLDYDQLIDAVGGRDQPLGVIAQALAAELRLAWGLVAEARGAATMPSLAPLGTVAARPRSRGPERATSRVSGTGQVRPLGRGRLAPKPAPGEYRRRG